LPGASDDDSGHHPQSFGESGADQARKGLHAVNDSHS